MADQRQTTSIEKDNSSDLEVAVNQFLSSTAKSVRNILCDKFIILDNGLQAHNALIQHSLADGAGTTLRIKLLLRDNTIDLEAAINAALTVLQVTNDIVDIQRDDYILDNGNRSYVACIIYLPAEYPASLIRVKIIEKDDVDKLNTAVNTFLLANNVTLNTPTIGVLYNQIANSDGNKLYICTIPYFPIG